MLQSMRSQRVRYDLVTEHTHKHTHTSLSGSFNRTEHLIEINSNEGRSLVVQVGNRLPMQGTRIRSLVWENTLEMEMATHSSILAWEITRSEGLGRLQSMGSQNSWT